MLAVYVERTGTEPNVLETQMNKETWFGGEVAKQLGFISAVLVPTTAKGIDYKLNSKKMNKEKQVTVKQSIIDKLLAKCGYQKIEDQEEESGDEEIEALKARIEELEAENAALKVNARTVEDNKILNAVKMAGGENWLAKHCSTYRVSLRAQTFKTTVDSQVNAEETPIQRKLREEREKRAKK